MGTKIILALIVIFTCIMILIESNIFRHDIKELKQRITELENLQLQKDIEEYKWRSELINDIKTK